MGNPLKSLLQERHHHAYLAFVAEYTRHASELDLPGHATPPTKAQYYRWVGGHNKVLPRSYHCMVLESMFPGWTARALFGFDQQNAQPHEPPPATENPDPLSSITPALNPALLEGLWCTGYILNGNQHHVDLSTITATDDAVAVKNYPPEPRFEGRPAGHKTDISARLFSRHIMGHWRNHNDSYYFGSLHLVVLPGETILDGYYTGFLDDTQILAQPWKWVRIEPQSAAGVDLTTVTLKEPGELYDALTAHTRFDGTLPLSHVISGQSEPQ